MTIPALSGPAFSGAYKVPFPAQTIETLKSVETAIDSSPEKQALKAAAEAHAKAVDAKEADKLEALGQTVQEAFVNLQKVVVAQVEKIQQAFEGAKPGLDKTIEQLKASGAKQVAVVPDQASGHFFIYTDDTVGQLKSIIEKTRDGQLGPKAAEAELKKIQSDAKELPA